MDNGPRCDEPISVNTGWRSGSGGRSKQQEKDEMIAEFETAVTNTDIKSSNCYSERTLPLDAFVGNEDLSGSKSVQYLKHDVGFLDLLLIVAWVSSARLGCPLARNKNKENAVKRLQISWVVRYVVLLVAWFSSARLEHPRTRKT